MRGSRESQENTRGYRGHSWLKGATTSGYRLLGITGWFYLFWNYSLLFYINIFIYKTFPFLIFLLYWKQLLKIDKILISQLWYTRW